MVGRPDNVWSAAPAGFKVKLYGSGFDNPRTLRPAPNGDIFLAESDPGRIRVFRGLTADGKPEQSSIFVSGLKQPYGLAFYPPGPDPQWLYVGSEAEVGPLPLPQRRFEGERIPATYRQFCRQAGSKHSTRPLEFSRDGKRMFVAVGLGSNADDPDTHPGEKDTAPTFWHVIPRIAC